MKSKIIVPIIIVVLVVAGLAWWASARPTVVPVTPPAVNNLPTPPDQSMADWKTYKNEEWGVEFKYPNDWRIEEDPSYPNQLLFMKKCLDWNNPQTCTSIDFGIDSNPNLTQEEYIEKIKAEIQRTSNITLEKIETLQISGFSANKFVVNRQGLRYNFFTLVRPDKIYGFEDYSAEGDSIVSSFRLLKP